MVSHQEAQVVVWYREAKSSFWCNKTLADSMKVTYQARKASRSGFTSFGDRKSSQTTWSNKQMCLTRLNKLTMCFGETWLNPFMRLPGILINRMEPLTLESACSRIPPYSPWLGKICQTPSWPINSVISLDLFLWRWDINWVYTSHVSDLPLSWACTDVIASQ